MNITLKNVKFSEFASQETNCFEATVYIDGKRAGVASNEGHGGCNNYYPNTLYATLNEYAETLPPIVSRYLDGNGKPMLLEHDADILIGDLFNYWLHSRDLKKSLSKSILFIGEDGKLWRSKHTDLKAALSRPDISQKLKAKQILNLMPFDAALEIYKGATT
jgi:hypothetical protein